MARNDGIDRTFARNQDLPTLDDVAKVQEHNEREKDSYSNQDIDTTQTYRNIHFKAPTDSYTAMFDQMIADGIISTRGLKADAVKYGELIFDVNSSYFHNHGGAPAPAPRRTRQAGRIRQFWPPPALPQSHFLPAGRWYP